MIENNQREMQCANMINTFFLIDKLNEKKRSKWKKIIQKKNLLHIFN